MTRPAECEKRIDYIEFVVSDIAKAKAFYGSAFNWTFQDWGEEYAAFQDGRMDGGFAKGTPNPGGPLVILYSAKLEEVRQDVLDAGGRLTKDIFSFPGGRRFQFTDPHGYELAVWSDK